MKKKTLEAAMEDSKKFLRYDQELSNYHKDNDSLYDNPKLQGFVRRSSIDLTRCAIRDAIKENNKALKQILYGLEYAAYNLCDGKKYTDLPHGIIESTCSEETLLISIRNLKILIDEADELV
jgi:hypothetical protein